MDTAEHNEGGAVPVKTLMLELKSDSGRVTIYIESKILLVKGRSHIFIGEDGGFRMRYSYQIQWVGGDRQPYFGDKDGGLMLS